MSDPSEHLPLSDPDAKRILFELQRHDEPLSPTLLSDETFLSRASELAQAIALMERDGAAPVLPDGKTGGNACCVLSSFPDTSTPPQLLLSRSGKQHLHALDPATDMCLVHNFDTAAWSCTFSSATLTHAPTSDTPLYWVCLVRAPHELGWTERPLFAMHGHALAKDEDKLRVWGIPLSERETRFSTREDTEEMMQLLRKWPWPEYKVWIRRNHGFFILGRDAQEVFNVYERVVRKRLTEIVYQEG